MSNQRMFAKTAKKCDEAFIELRRYAGRRITFNELNETNFDLMT